MIKNLFTTSFTASNRYGVAGSFMLLMTILLVMRFFFPGIPEMLAGMFAWVAMLLLVPRLNRSQLLQVTILVLIGFICLGWAIKRGANIEIEYLLSSNIKLLALLTGVNYLRLITLQNTKIRSSLPKGDSAFLRTLFGLHLFSAVINLSALLIVADRLANGVKLSKQSFIPLMRAFTTAAFWSPFFAAMGVTLTYVPDASITQLVLQGLPLALIGLLYTLWESYRQKGTSIQQFEGYPMDFASLWVPAVLIVAVILLHHGFPYFPVILWVAGLSLLLTVVVSFWRNKDNALQQLTNHTLVELPKMSGELTLFLSAGVLSFGLNHLLQTMDQHFLPTTFSPAWASGVLALIIGLALIGIHPIISIVILGTWLAPLDINPNILGTLFLCSWALGVVGSPLSGMNLALQGRFELKAKQVYQWHYRYLGFMFVTSSLWLWGLMEGSNG